MGFNSAVKDRPKFVPTTPKELRAIEKRAKEREKAKREKPEEPRSKHRWPRGATAIRAALAQRQPVFIRRGEMFDTLVDMCKTAGMKPPAYRLYEKTKDADASFMFDLQQVLARLNWRQLAEVVDKAVGVPVPSRTFSDAFWFAMQVIVQAFEVENYLESKKGEQTWIKINDRDALEQWPIPGRKRKSSSDNEETEMLVDEDNRRKLSARGDDEEEEDEVAEDDGDEDEDENDDGDEKPARKKPAAKKKAGGFGGKKKRVAKDDDDDEEDSKPTRKRRAVKDDDDDEDDAPAKVVLSEKSIVAKVKERDKGGPKSKLLALIPKKGISVKELTAAAKEEGIAAGKVKPFVTFLEKYEYIKIK